LPVAGRLAVSRRGRRLAVSRRGRRLTVRRRRLTVGRWRARARGWLRALPGSRLRRRFGGCAHVSVSFVRSSGPVVRLDDLPPPPPIRIASGGTCIPVSVTLLQRCRGTCDQGLGGEVKEACPELADPLLRRPLPSPV